MASGLYSPLEIKMQISNNKLENTGGGFYLLDAVCKRFLEFCRAHGCPRASLVSPDPSRVCHISRGPSGLVTGRRCTP